VRRLAAVVVVFLACAASLPAAAAVAAAPRASLTDIENDVMCPSCRESLSVAQSPQAMAERAYIQGLINQGLDKKQIEQNLVGQYGPAVLAKPPADGFNLTVYVLPAVLVAGGLALLAVVLPRWRRAARARRAEPVAGGPDLAPSDAGRLEDELSRFAG
jgi:cytochrome c-type biogenesis protein CcmH